MSHSMTPRLEATLAYHRRTRHQPHRFAASLGYMDWDTQPDPFRRYPGAPLRPLDPSPPDEGGPRYEPAFLIGGVAPEPPGRAAISRLLRDSLSLSAWKRAGTARWSLRVNPSSGNLHPTEGYLVAGPVAGLWERPTICHYAPEEHALELRAELGAPAWEALAAQLPEGALLVGLTSIHLRESWKYGERAFRYCQHDLGHAIGAVAVAAAGLGWEARLLDGVGDDALGALLGVDARPDLDAEQPDALLALYPQGADFPTSRQRAFHIPDFVRGELRQAPWSGAPNRLTAEHQPWPVIEEVTEASRQDAPPPDAFWESALIDNPSLVIGDSPLRLRRIIHQRRSAVALDGRTGIARSAFYQILLKALPGRNQIPFTTLPFRPHIDLLLFVHRVADLAPGLYALVRDPSRRGALQSALDPRFAWATPPGCPPSLPLFLLEEGDCRRAAEQASCGQEIAANGVFAVAMLAEYRAPLERLGPFFYRRLHWEAGVIGQLLYLEAEASGIRATGIGCFFDDATHFIFGIRDDRFQVLYHFTMGGPVDDPRLQNEPPYRFSAI
jgi:SagB-type dehydrogenase family enzyme